MNTNLTFRKAEKTDADRVLELFLEMQQNIHGCAFASGHTTADFDYYFAGGEDWICVAEINGEVIAFLSMEVHREKPAHLYLDDLSVTKAHRNKGVGSALLAQAETYARQVGMDTIALHVEKSNHSAQRLYERRGFVLFRDDGTRLCMIRNL